jgi:hypothetical protein
MALLVTPLVVGDKIKSPAHVDDLTGLYELSALPTWSRVLMMLLCTLVAVGFAYLLLN